MKHSKDEQGYILLIVLILMVVVSALTMDIVKSVRYEYSGASYVKNCFASSSLLESACSTSQDMFANSVLNKNGTAFQTFAADMGTALDGMSSLFSAGELSGKVEDENGRFPLSMYGKNATILENVMSNLLVNLCRQHGYEGDNKNGADAFVQSMRCWTGNSTACNEDSVSDDAESGYLKPGRPITTPDELLMIPRADDWLTDEEFKVLYFGTDKITGLEDLVTSFSDGKMNINYLKDEIIMSFVPVGYSDEDRKRFLVAVRDAKKGNDGEGDWFAEVRSNYNTSEYKKNIPAKEDLGYSTDSARVTINYNNGIYKASLMEVFKFTDTGAGKSVQIKYKKYGN